MEHADHVHDMRMVTDAQVKPLALILPELGHLRCLHKQANACIK